MGSAFARVNVSGALKKLQGLEKIIQEEAINMSREIAEFGELEDRKSVV